MKLIDVIAAVLLVIGGLNWGLWGLFEFDLVSALFGGSTDVASRFVYILVGAAAIYQASNLKGIQTRWNVSMA
ncbi:MAG: DUF378 domain-containing protein [Phycisphaerae bacterium]|jgi:hypothetical protein|nr:DUF378 domain-containing protein [Phycisphaerae bacterium]